MAKRQRDYRAEERRRNELARQRGYTTRAAERGAKTRADYSTAGFTSHTDYTNARRNAQSWSDLHSHGKASEYNPKFKPQQLSNYLKAFDVEHDTPKRVRHDALKKYLVSEFPEDYPDESHAEFWANY